MNTTDEKDQVITEIVIYGNQNNRQLPLSGWFQPCYFCEKICSNEKKYKEIVWLGDIYVVNIYVCKECNKFMFINNKKEYNEEEKKRYNSLQTSLNKKMYKIYNYIQTGM